MYRNRNNIHDNKLHPFGHTKPTVPTRIHCPHTPQHIYYGFSTEPGANGEQIYMRHARAAQQKHDFAIKGKTHGADEGNRTPVCSLGSCRSTIELHPHSAWAAYSAPPPCVQCLTGRAGNYSASTSGPTRSEIWPSSRRLMPSGGRERALPRAMRRGRTACVSRAWRPP